MHHRLPSRPSVDVNLEPRSELSAAQLRPSSRPGGEKPSSRRRNKGRSARKEKPYDRRRRGDGALASVCHNWWADFKLGEPSRSPRRGGADCIW